MPFRTSDVAFKEIVTARALTVLRRLAKRGTAVKIRKQSERSMASCSTVLVRSEIAAFSQLAATIQK
jgi:hypothetical protein